MSRLPDDLLSPWMVSQTCGPAKFEHKLPTMHADPPASSGFTRLEAKLDLLLVEIMELRCLLSTAPIDPEEGWS